MAASFEAIVKPQLLVWARTSAGYAIVDAAHKAKVKLEKLEAWERGDARPTIAQLRELARVYKRPLAVFFLSEPPQDFQPPHDFRRLPQALTQPSPALRYEIRRAHYRRDVGIDLYKDTGEIPPQFSLSATLDEDPELLADRLRQYLGILFENQIEWKSDYDGLSHWRSALEKLGVLVFQARGISLDEMRGFSISDLPLPVICTNGKDSPRARIFSILHEFVHIVLRRGGLCDLDDQRRSLPEEQRVEIYCNRVAGAMMVPKVALLQEPSVSSKQDVSQWSDYEIRQLANRYKASQEVILRRLLLLGRITKGFYENKRDTLHELQEGKAPKKGFATIEQRTLASTGILFANLVLSSYYQERITSSSLSDLLEVKLRHMPKIEKALFGRAIEFGAAG